MLKMRMLLIVLLEALSNIHNLTNESGLKQSTLPNFLDEVMSETSLIFGVDFKFMQHLSVVS
jgi:hypothetical protein